MGLDVKAMSKEGSNKDWGNIHLLNENTQIINFTISSFHEWGRGKCYTTVFSLFYEETQLKLPHYAELVTPPKKEKLLEQFYLILFDIGQPHI